MGSEAYAINNAGHVVGTSGDSSGRPRAFLYDGTIKDLNDLIDNALGWTLTHASDINNSGQITGYGTIGGEEHAFLLTPIPEPGTITLLLCSLASVVIMRRR